MNKEKKWKRIVDEAANAGFLKYCYGGVALLDIDCDKRPNRDSIPAPDVIQIIKKHGDL